MTKNPFKSMYFAAQSMAAEFSTAVLLVSQIEKSGSNIALIIVSMKADFLERATEKIYFKCHVDNALELAVTKAINTGEPVTIELSSKGLDISGNMVSQFWFTWSLKLRS